MFNCPAANQWSVSQADALVGFTLKLALSFLLQLSEEDLEVSRQFHCDRIR